MEIILLVIVSLTFIAVGTGLFLNHKNNLNITAKIVGGQENITQHITSIRNEMVDKIQQLSVDTSSRIEATKIEYISTLNNGIQKMQGDLSQLAKNMENNISLSKSETITAILPTLNSVRDELQSTHNKLQKEIVPSLGNMREEIQSTYIKLQNEIDGQLKNHLQKQNEFANDVNGKFNKIIDEIKSPLTLD